jgi:hypothetical protein
MLENRPSFQHLHNALSDNIIGRIFINPVPLKLNIPPGDLPFLSSEQAGNGFQSRRFSSAVRA